MDYTGKIDPNLKLPESSFPLLLSEDEAPSLQKLKHPILTEVSEVINNAGDQKSDVLNLSSGLDKLAVSNEVDP